MANLFDSTNWLEYPPEVFIAVDYFVKKYPPLVIAMPKAFVR